MTKQELIEKIRKGTDIMFKIGEKGFTICDSVDYDDGKDIAPWGGDGATVFPDAETLVNQFLIDGIPLGDLAQDVMITDYTLSGTA